MLTLVFIYITASMSMTFPLEYSRTWRMIAFHSQRTRRWEFTRLFGMLMIGRHKEDASRQTGETHHLLLPTETSVRMLVFGLMEHLLAILARTVRSGNGRRLITQSKDRWNGRRIIIWYTITAKTINDFPKDSLQNAIYLERRNNLRIEFIRSSFVFPFNFVEVRIRFSHNFMNKIFQYVFFTLNRIAIRVTCIM